MINVLTSLRRGLCYEVYSYNYYRGKQNYGDFPTISEAAHWLDAECNNPNATMLIESFDENGIKKDEFLYTNRIK